MQICLAGHLFDQFLINEALDVIEAAGGRFSVASCHVGQSSRATSSAELHVAADSAAQLAEVVEALAEVAGVFFPRLPPAVRALTRTGTIEKARQRQRSWDALHSAERRSLSPAPRFEPTGFKAEEAPQAGSPAGEARHLPNGDRATAEEGATHTRPQRELSLAGSNGITAGLPHVLLLGAGRMCEPVVRHLTSGADDSESRLGGVGNKAATGGRKGGFDDWRGAQVTVASLLEEEAQRAAALGGPRCRAVQVDTRNEERLAQLVRDSDVVISLLPPACHVAVAQACIAAGKDLVTASYVSDEMQALDGAAQAAGVVLLCEMGLDPGIGEGPAATRVHSRDLWALGFRLGTKPVECRFNESGRFP